MKKRLSFYFCRALALTTVSVVFHAGTLHAQQAARTVGTTIVSQVSEGLLHVPLSLENDIRLPELSKQEFPSFSGASVIHNTGRLSLNVPFYTISAGGTSTPVLLTYINSGIRVDDQEDMVGLGWNIAVGGSITRIIRGLPDDTDGLPFEYKTGFSEGSTSDAAYLRDVVHRKREANHDWYQYRFGNWSGYFIISSGNIVPLTKSDLRIEKTGTTPTGMTFTIVTPDGTSYRFTEKEKTSLQSEVHSLEPLIEYTSGDYSDAVHTWYLSSIVNATETDTVTFAYRSVTETRSIIPEILKTRSDITYTNGMSSSVPTNPDMPVSTTVTLTDRRIPHTMTWRGGRIEFESGKDTSSGRYHINKITLYSTDGAKIREMTLEYVQGTLGRKLLSAIRTTSSGKLVDSRTFTYYPGYDHTENDMFRYSNYGYISGASDSLTIIEPILPDDPLLPGEAVPYSLSGQTCQGSVLGTDGLMSDTRAYHFPSATGMALKEMTTATGATETYTYEPNTAHYTSRDVSIGVRVKTVISHGTATGERVTRYTYENGRSTTDFDIVFSSPAHFITTGGNLYKTTVITEQGSGYHTSGATFTSSCRIPGASAQDAVIYYGKVTEDIYTTGLQDTVRTVYEFDTSDIEDTYVGGAWTGGDGTDNERYTGTRITYSGQYTTLARIYGPQIIGGHFRNTLWEKAPLLRKVSYRFSDGVFDAVEEEQHVYSIDKEEPFNTGLFVEGRTRKLYNHSNGFFWDVMDNLRDFNVVVTSVQAGRLFLESSTMTRYYHNGASRTVTVEYEYGGRGSNVLPLEERDFLPLPADSTVTSSMALIEKVTLRYGTNTIEYRFCRSCNVNTPFFSALRTRGVNTLPVWEKVTVDGTDTLTTRHAYTVFGTERNIQEYMRTLTYNGREVDRTEYKAYDLWGNMLAATENHKSPRSYVWGYNGTLPVAFVQGTAIQQSLSLQEAEALRSQAGVLVTTYAHEPLVGCTSMKRPDGSVTSYGYSGGMLSRIIDSEGNTSHTYSMSLAAEGGLNSTTETVWKNPGIGIARIRLYDAFGNTVNEVQKNASEEGKDILRSFVYDGMGRKVETLLPVPRQNVTGYVSASVHKAAAQQYYGCPDPVQHTEYENSVRSLLLSQTLPGAGIKDHPAYSYIISSDPSIPFLRCLRYVLQGDYAVGQSGTYAKGELDAVKTTDPDGRVYVVFLDWQGRKILERRLDGNTTVDTYFIYDRLGLLRFVLPPAAADLGGGTHDIRTDQTLRDYACYYRYDNSLNLVEKKLPGAEPVYYIYDKTRTAVFSQDGNLRQKGRWEFTLCDVIGRETVKGTCGQPDAVAAAGKWVYTGLPDFAGYTATPDSCGYILDNMIQNAEILSASYYDDCNAGAYLNARFGANATENTPERKGTKAAEICSTLPRGGWMYTQYRYDAEGNLIRSRSNTIKGGTVSGIYSYFTDGSPSETNLYHSDSGPVLSERMTYAYDSAGREKSVTHSVNGATAVNIMERTFDAVGNEASIAHGGVGTLTSQFSYTLNGWLSGIASSLFSENIYYSEIRNGNTPLYGGGISAIEWQDAYGVNTLRGYNFSYDPLNRLVAAAYRENGAPSAKYSTSYAYDCMGNPTHVVRNGKRNGGQYGSVDDLTMTYSGNRLAGVSDSGEGLTALGSMHYPDSGGSYTYDANGNMTSDSGRGIVVVTHNILNLPEHVAYSDGSYVDYTYSADGTKLRTDYHISSPAVEGGAGTEHLCREYAGGKVYDNGILKHLVTKAGYVTFQSDGTPRYHYFLCDHLGNVRVVADETGSIEEVNHYYPYGMLMDCSHATTTQPYKFTMKELDRMHGIDWYDYGARMYDPAAMTWRAMDTFTEKNIFVSPYLYCMGNPVNIIDIYGHDTINICYSDSDGKWRYSKPIIAKGNDVFNVTVGNETNSYFFTEGEYGERVVALNLESDYDCTLGVYHISGCSNLGTGFYVTPKGEPSTKTGSKARIPDGVYEIIEGKGKKWKKPGVGGSVIKRGIRFHYSIGNIPRKSTDGCYVLAYDYKFNDKDEIVFDKKLSKLTSRYFDILIGGACHYYYDENREGVKFDFPINAILIQKSK